MGRRRVHDYKEDMDRSLFLNYKKLVSEADYICAEDIYKKVVDMPTERFWVSEEAAAEVVASMMKGKKVNIKNNTRREMFTEIYNRFIKMKKRFPDLPFCELISKVVHMPAPKFYVTPGTAKVVIHYFKKRWYEEKKKKLRHLLG